MALQKGQENIKNGFHPHPFGLDLTTQMLEVALELVACFVHFSGNGADLAQDADEKVEGDERAHSDKKNSHTGYEKENICVYNFAHMRICLVYSSLQKVFNYFLHLCGVLGLH